MARGLAHRTDPLTRRRTLAAIAAGSALVLRAGCLGAPVPDPLGPQRRQQIREATIDVHWAPVPSSRSSSMPGLPAQGSATPRLAGHA